MSQTQADLDDEDFDLESFKRKGLEDEPKLAPTLSSYSLFNNAPFGGGASPVPPIKITTSYSSDSLAFGATSDDGGSEIPGWSSHSSLTPRSQVAQHILNFCVFQHVVTIILS
jgi:hypothetical protein